MKILMVNDYAYPIGGTEVYLFEIIEKLKQRGHQVELFTSAVTTKEYFSPKYNKSFFKYMERIFNISTYKKFKKVITQFNPDIIHIHGICNEITPSVLWGIQNTAIVMTVHGMQFISPVSLQTERTGRYCKEENCEGCTNCIGWKGYLYEIIKKHVYRILLKKVQLYIAPSDYLKVVLEKKNYLPTILLYNGIHLLSYKQIEQANRLLFAGRIIKEKGVGIIITAMKILVKKIPGIHLTIIGEGSDLNFFKEKTKQNYLKKHITFAGVVTRKMMQGYYHKATIVLIPSIYPDNLPTVGLEALSVGRPIIGANIGGIPEIVKQGITGVLTESGNSNQIVRSVEELLGNKKKLEKMSKNARIYAEKNFDIEKHVQKLEEVYKSLFKN